VSNLFDSCLVHPDRDAYSLSFLVFLKDSQLFRFMGERMIAIKKRKMERSESDVM
jgi:hypothetical protein